MGLFDGLFASASGGSSGGSLIPTDFFSEVERGRAWREMGGSKFTSMNTDKALREREEEQQTKSFDECVKHDMLERELETGIYDKDKREYLVATTGVDPLVTPIDGVAAESMRRQGQRSSNSGSSQKNSPSAQARSGSVSSGNGLTEKMPSYVFAVEIDNVECAQFEKCEGLSVIGEILERAEGGDNTAMVKLHTGTRYGNVTLSNGIVGSDGMLLKWLQGNVASDSPNKKSCSLILKEMNGPEVARWNIYGAMPVRWSLPVGGQMKKGSFSTKMIETVELAIDRFEAV